MLTPHLEDGLRLGLSGVWQTPVATPSDLGALDTLRFHRRELERQEMRLTVASCAGSRLCFCLRKIRCRSCTEQQVSRQNWELAIAFGLLGIAMGGVELGGEGCRDNARKIERTSSSWISCMRQSDRRPEAMSERYEVSVALIVQAVRLLEDCGVLQLRKGRLGGIDLTGERNSAQAILAANAYFTTHSVSVADCDSLVRTSNIAIIERAAQCESVSLDSVEQALSAMRHADEPTAVGMQWYALQCVLSDRAGNAPLHLLVKCLAAYVVRVRTCRSLTMRRPGPWSARASEWSRICAEEAQPAAPKLTWRARRRLAQVGS